MADNLTTTTTVSTIPSGTKLAAREVTYSGDASSFLAPVGIVLIAGADDAKTATDVSNSAPLPVSDAGGSLTVDGTVAVSGTVTVGSHAVTNAGTFAVQVDGSALTALQLIDNIVLAEDAVHSSTDAGVQMLAVRRDSASSGAADGDYCALSVDSNGSLRVVNGGTTSVLVDDAAFTPGTSAVSAVGFTADESSTDSVDEGDIGAARMTLDRKQIVVNQPHSAGGLSIFRTLDADETEEDVKTSAGCIYGMWVTNTGTATAFLKLYNATAANVTVGTTTPVITIGIPGNSSDDVSGNFGPGGTGIFFDTAISVAAVTEAADNGTTAPAANSVIVNIFYK